MNVITKTDLVDSDQLFQTVRDVRDSLRKLSDLMPMEIHSDEDVVLCARTIQEEGISPIFQVSNKSGAQIEHFKMFLNLLPTSSSNSTMFKNAASGDEFVEFHINETLRKPEGNCEYILSGMMRRGTVSVK